MRRMRACGWGLRSILPHNMPGTSTSAAKRVRPVTLSGPAIWATGAPIIVTDISI